MTVDTIIVARRGHMSKKGNYISDEVKAQATDTETGCVGWAYAKTDKQAIKQAESELGKALEEHARLQDPDVIEARARKAYEADMALAAKLRRSKGEK